MCNELLCMTILLWNIWDINLTMSDFSGEESEYFLTVCKISVDPLSDFWEKTAKLTKRSRTDNGVSDGC